MPLTEFFTGNAGLKGKVTRAYREFALAMCRRDKRSISAASLRSVVVEGYPLFDNREQHDSHEFLIVLLNQLHEENNRSPKVRGIPRPKHPNGIELDQYLNESIVSKLFHGFTQSVIRYDCGHEECVYEPVISWTLPLPTGRSVVSFEDSFAFWQKTERFDEDCLPFCDECGEERAASKGQCVWRFSPIVIMRFGRFEEGPDGRIRKNNVAVKYPISFRAEDYEKEPNSSPGRYDLFGVILHGGRLTGGHYTCLVRDTEQMTKWYDISDASVREVSEHEAHTRSAYVLIYRRDPTANGDPGGRSSDVST
jgi:ubiquitin C-terminal hydrolase